MAKRRYILAVDQGTTGTHVTVLDDRLKVSGQAYREFPQVFPQPGWVEHDLDAIWHSVERCIAKGLKDAGIDPSWVSAIGITNQRETTGLWRRDNGKPVHRAIVWQDRRTADVCAALKARGEGPWSARKRAWCWTPTSVPPSWLGFWTTWTGRAPGLRPA